MFFFAFSNIYIQLINKEYVLQFLRNSIFAGKGLPGNYATIIPLYCHFYALCLLQNYNNEMICYICIPSNFVYTDRVPSFHFFCWSAT